VAVRLLDRLMPHRHDTRDSLPGPPKGRWYALYQSRAIKKAGSALKLLLFLSVGAFLLHRLSAIGWDNVLGALPAEPVFYLLLILHFLLIPSAELLVFDPLWRDSQTPRHTRFLAFLRKQALNDTVLGYSGDAYLLWWGRRNLGIGKTRIFHSIKDSTLLSAACSSSLAVLVAGTLYMFGYLAPLTANLPDAAPMFVGVLGLSVLVIPLLALFGRKILGLSDQDVRRICSVHVTRQLISEALLILQWRIVLPDVAISVWLGLVAARMVVTRVPMIPNKELTMLALAAGVAGQLEGHIPSAAALAGLFLARAGVMQILNGLVLTVFSLPALRRQFGPISAGDDAETVSPDVPHRSDEPSNPAHSSG